MKIEKARAVSRLILLLHKLELIDWNRADKLIDVLTVRCLKDPDNI